MVRAKLSELRAGAGPRDTGSARAGSRLLAAKICGRRLHSTLRKSGLERGGNHDGKKSKHQNKNVSCNLYLTFISKRILQILKTKDKLDCFDMDKRFGINSTEQCILLRN